MEIAEQEQDPSLLSEAHLLVGLGHALARPSSPTRSSTSTRWSVNFEATGSGHVDFHVGPNPGVVAIVVSALTRWLLGSPDAACTTMQRALDLAAELDHPYSMAYALQHAALLDLWQGDLAGMADTGRRVAGPRRGARLPDVAGARRWCSAGWRMVGSGDADAGLARVEEGVELYKGLCRRRRCSGRRCS